MKTDNELLQDVELLPDDVKLGEKDQYGIGLDMKVETGSITPKEVWDQKDKFIKMIEDSNSKFNGLSDEEKAAVFRCVRSGIGRLYDNVENWLPDAFVDDKVGGTTLTVYINMIWADLEEELKRFEVASSKQIESAQDEVLAILKD